MPDPTPTSAVPLLVEALDHLAINGHIVTLDGEPTRYLVDGQPSIEGEIVALAFRLMRKCCGTLTMGLCRAIGRFYQKNQSGTKITD